MFECLSRGRSVELPAPSTQAKVMENLFKNYKFRCSGLANLLVNPRAKGEILSETTKTYLNELWVKEMFQRERYVTSKYMRKGTIVETDSIAILDRVTNTTNFKNIQHFENEYITGTPDIVNDDEVIDIKSSWDIFTYHAVTEKKALDDYEAQLQGYMWLTDKPKSRLIYSLTNTPIDQAEHELYVLKISGAIEDTEEMEAKARRNFVYDDVPDVLRLKQFRIERDQMFQIKLVDRIIAAREYMSTICL